MAWTKERTRILPVRKVKPSFGLLLVLLAGCVAGGKIQTESGLQTKAGAKSISAVFRPGEVIAFGIKSDSGELIGRSHSLFQTSKSGILKIRTRMVLHGEGTESTLAFNAKKIPVRYKRISSKHGKLEIDFRKKRLLVLNEDQSSDHAPWRKSGLPLAEGDIMMLQFALHGLVLHAGSSHELVVFDVERLRGKTMTLTSYLDAQQRAVVNLPLGTATLDDKGRIRSFTSSKGHFYVPEIPPQNPPQVRYRALLKYREPHSPPWTERPVSIGPRKGVLAIPEQRSRWPNLRAPLAVILSDGELQDRYGLSERMDRGTWEIQNRLLESGYAVLRIDDQLELESTESLQALLAFMSGQPDVDAERLLFFGQGRGGWAALRAGLLAPDLVQAVGLFATGTKNMPAGLKSALRSSIFPIAVFQGLKDFEVSWKDETKSLVRDLQARPGGKKGCKAIYYSRVDHLMKQEPKESTAKRYEDRSRRIENTFLNDLIHWLDDIVFAQAQK